MTSPRHAPTPGYTQEQCVAWRAVLRALYEQYPSNHKRVQINNGQIVVDNWRRLSLDPGTSLNMSMVYAQDTGVPNEEIKAAFALIFG